MRIGAALSMNENSIVGGGCAGARYLTPERIWWPLSHIRSDTSALLRLRFLAPTGA
jgi:hypothetical protein